MRSILSENLSTYEIKCFSFTDMERVLARHEEKPLVLNEARLSIRSYHAFLEGEEGVDELSYIGATEDETSKTQMRQQPVDKPQQIQISVDPDVMEYVTITAF